MNTTFSAEITEAVETYSQAVDALGAFHPADGSYTARPSEEASNTAFWAWERAADEARASGYAAYAALTAALTAAGIDFESESEGGEGMSWGIQIITADADIELINGYILAAADINR